MGIEELYGKTWLQEPDAASSNDLPGFVKQNMILNSLPGSRLPYLKGSNLLLKPGTY